LDADPACLDFADGPHGKPALASAFADKGIHFNLSHSESLALIAVTRLGPVGVDLEKIRAVRNDGELAARFFSTHENGVFQAVPKDGQAEAFFNLWTRKEAWLKATGEGIGRLLNQVEVTFLAGEPTRLLRLPAQFGELADWTLNSFNPARGFVAALAVRAKVVELNFRDWASGS
jgi:4'-phosphopantetheinyl transferase